MLPVIKAFSDCSRRLPDTPTPSAPTRLILRLSTLQTCRPPAFCLALSTEILPLVYHGSPGSGLDLI